MEALHSSSKTDVKEFFKRHNIINDPKNSNISYFLKKVRKTPNRLIKEDQILTQFNLDLDQCKYFDLQSIEDLEIFKIIPSFDKKKKVVLLFGHLFPSDKKLLEKTFLVFIDNLSKLVADHTYIFYYFHHKNYKSLMGFIKNAYKRLPLKYIFNLEKLYVIHGGIAAKSAFLMQSNFHAKLLKSKVKYIKDINKLKKDDSFHPEYLEYFPEDITKKTEESLMVSHQLPKHVEIIGIDITDFSLSDNGIPEVISLLVSYFEMDSKYLKTKGIFRNTSSEKDIKKLEKALIEQNFDLVFEIDNPHIVASLLKRILNKTLEPIMLYENYDELTAIGKINEKNQDDYVNKLSQLMKKLPKLNQKILSFVIAFIRKVIKKKEDNLMDSFNMAMVFAPCFIRPKVYSAEDIAKASCVISCLKYIIENYQAIFEEKFVDSEAESFVGIEEFNEVMNENQQQMLKINVFEPGLKNELGELHEKDNKSKEMSKFSIKFQDNCKSDFEGKKNNERKRVITQQFQAKDHKVEKTNKKAWKEDGDMEEHKNEDNFLKPEKKKTNKTWKIDQSNDFQI